ncbi:MAG: NUDIX hydrolase [Clostridia bacterium]
MTAIRLASSVILVRENKQIEKDRLEVYTTKRPDTMKFLPGFTVFPGGAIEQDDTRAEWCEYIEKHWDDHLLLPKHSGYPGDSLPIDELEKLELAHAIGAVREVFEETGLLIAQARPASSAAQPNNWEPRQLLAHRQALHNKEITFLELIQSLGIKLDLGTMLHIGRRLTPPTSPIRFNTQFFLTYVPSHITMMPSVHEVAADAWVEPSLALQQCEQGQIACAPPTRECFRALAQLADQQHFLKRFSGKPIG